MVHLCYYHGRAQRTGAVAAAVLLAVCWVESKVELVPEEGSIVGVDQLKHALMDDVGLKAERAQILAEKRRNHTHTHTRARG